MSFVSHANYINIISINQVQLTIRKLWNILYDVNENLKTRFSKMNGIMSNEVWVLEISLSIVKY